MGARYALIGGLALAPYDVIRATQDVDLLVDLENADAIERELTGSAIEAFIAARMRPIACVAMSASNCSTLTVRRPSGCWQVPGRS